jgi:hypothetical protein
MIRVMTFECSRRWGLELGCPSARHAKLWFIRALGVLFLGAVGMPRLATAQTLSAAPQGSLSAHWAQEDAQDEAQRALLLEKVRHQKSLLQSQMDAVQAEYSRQVQLCTQRFAVTGCQLDAQTQRIQHLRPLKEEMISLDDLERAIKAQEALEALAEKQSEESQARERSRMLDAQKAYDERMAQHAKVVSEHDRQEASLQKPAERATEKRPTPQEQAQALQAYEKKLANAREHQAQVQKNLREKATRPKPLPPFEEVNNAPPLSPSPLSTAGAKTSPSTVGRAP